MYSVPGIGGINGNQNQRHYKDPDVGYHER
jgi:hypothetical protein